MRGIEGIKGFWDEIRKERIKYKKDVEFPDLSRTGVWERKIVTVGPFGEMYPTIVSAVAARPQPVAFEPYIILVSGGIYEGGFTLPSDTHIISLGPTSITSQIIVVGSSSLRDVHFLILFGESIEIISGNLTLLRTSITGDVVLSGNSMLSLKDVSGNFSILVSGPASTLSFQNVKMTGDISKAASGYFNFSLQNSDIEGQIYTEVTSHQFSIRNSRIINTSSKPPIQLEAGVAGSYLHLAHSTLVTDPVVPTIDKSGGVGNLEVWSHLNGLTSAYANVNENIAVGGNVIDPSIK